MGRLLVFLFLLPWWAYIPAAVGVVWLGERAYEMALETEAEKAAALESPMPEAVDLSAFDQGRDTHAAGEVHITGWIDTDLNYELVKRRNGIATDRRFMFAIFGADDQVGAKEVRGALLLTEKQRDAFVERIDDFAIGFTDVGDLIFAFNGTAEYTPNLWSMAKDAIEEQGRVRSEEFIFIEPFFEGREAALAPQGIPERTRYIGWAIAAVVALFGVAKRISSVRSRKDPVDLTEGVDSTGQGPDPAMSTIPEPAAAAPSFHLPAGVDANSPLGRLARKGAPVAAELQDPTLVPDAYGRSIEEAKTALAATETTPDAINPRPRSAPIYDSGASPGGAADSPFPPVPDEAAAPKAAQGSSTAGFYAKLALGMLAVGAVAYDPSIIRMALPFAVVAGFWFGVYVLVKNLRKGGAKLGSSLTRIPRHQRRPDSAGHALASGAGGHEVDLTAPVRSTGRRERGVI